MFRELLREHAGHLPRLTEDQVSALEEHFELLVKWNRMLNLSAVRNEPEIVERHYAESLFLGARIPVGAWSIADIGSGGGFPGAPIAILRPECRITLIESHQRKAVFLRESTRGFGNVRILAKRAEDVEEQFDWTVSRGVRLEEIQRTLSRISSHCGLLVGSNVQKWPAEFAWSDPVVLPWGEKRHLVLGQKCST